MFFYYTQGNNVEHPALTYDGDLPVSLNHLNNTDPSRTAMASGSSPMQGSLAPQGQARACLHFLYNYLHLISIFHEKIITDSLLAMF
jgi:hypothetical protein